MASEKAEERQEEEGGQGKREGVRIEAAVLA